MSLDQMRISIDVIDDKILQLLEQRMELVKMIGYKKKINNVNILCQNREDEIFTRLEKKSNLDKIFIKTLWKEIMSYSKIIQSLN